MKKTKDLINKKDIKSINDFYIELSRMYGGQLKSMFDKELSNIIDNSKYNRSVVRISQMNDTNWNGEFTVFVVPNKYNWDNVYELKLIKENNKLVIKNANKSLVNSNVLEIFNEVYNILDKAYNKYDFIHCNNKKSEIKKEKQYDVREVVIVKSVKNDSKLNSYKPKTNKNGGKLS